MEDCIFCKIVNGDIPCSKIYEDENVIAFLDISPLSKGHTLVVPKNHYRDILDVSDEDLCNCINVVKKISRHLKEVYNPEGFVLRQNTGEKAGQSVHHLHFHIKPVYSDTMVISEVDHRREYTEEEMKEIVKEVSMLTD